MSGIKELVQEVLNSCPEQEIFYELTAEYETDRRVIYRSKSLSSVIDYYEKTAQLNTTLKMFNIYITPISFFHIEIAKATV